MLANDFAKLCRVVKRGAFLHELDAAWTRSDHVVSDHYWAYIEPREVIYSNRLGRVASLSHSWLRIISEEAIVSNIQCLRKFEEDDFVEAAVEEARRRRRFPKFMEFDWIESLCSASRIPAGRLSHLRDRLHRDDVSSRLVRPGAIKAGDALGAEGFIDGDYSPDEASDGESSEEETSDGEFDAEEISVGELKALEVSDGELGADYFSNDESDS